MIEESVKELKLCGLLILRLFRYGFKTRARNGDEIWCGRTVVTPVATSAVPERRYPRAPAILRPSDRQPAYSATVTACPRPRWRSYTPFIICIQAFPLRSPFPISTDDGLKWKRMLTVVSPAILDEGLLHIFVNRTPRRNLTSRWRASIMGLSKKSRWWTLTLLTYRGSDCLSLVFFLECDPCRANFKNNYLNFTEVDI